MHHYKSLMLVAMLGGVILCVAGMMTTFEKAARTQSAEEAEQLTESSRLTDLRIRVPRVGRRPEGQLEADLAIVRETFNREEPVTVAEAEKARGHLNRAADSLRSGDWPLLAKEFQLDPLHEGYRLMLLVLAGASTSDEALPVIAAHWSQHPGKVADALQSSGTPGAFATARKLFLGQSNDARRLIMLRAMKRFPQNSIREFLLELVGGQLDGAVAKQVLTMLRHHRHADVVAALDTYVRRAAPVEMELPKRALNSLTGLRLEAANIAVLEIYLDESLDRMIRNAAGEALAFARAEALVPRVLEELRGRDPKEFPGLISFLNRNAGSEHLVPMTTLYDELEEGDAKEVLGTMLERLRS